MNIRLHSPGQRRGFTRRNLIEAGSLAALNLSLAHVLKADETQPRPGHQAAAPPGSLVPARAKSCILFFMEGGPSHIDLWDMKPDAPEQVRGIYSPIDTSLPGLRICDQLPQLATRMHHFATVRSVSHRIVDHNASTYYMLTGQAPFRDGQLIRGPGRDNAPPFGSVLAKFRPTGRALPDYVHLPKRMFNCGHFIPGVLAGFLGDRFDPFIAGDASQSDYEVPGLERRVADRRLSRRRRLLRDVDRILGTLGDDRALDRLDTFYDKAFSLVTSPDARRAFRIQDETESTRRRYGLPRKVDGVRGGGLPHLGQSMLLARRLVEAGVRLVSVWAGGQAFDGHRNHFNSLTRGLCPATDRALSALIDDLDERGLLDSTLVIALAEFGRTPKLGQITSTAGATPDGRDHWPNAYTVFLAGAGVRAGTVHGATDRIGAYPTESPVSPEDVAATVYQLLGIDPLTRIRDPLNRPHTLAPGRPIAPILS